MTSELPAPALALVVIGGLTIDRFADGSSAPGGSVLHAARAAARRGVGVGVITVAGPEPEAQAGMEELRGLGALLTVSTAATTWQFRHEEAVGGRRLWLEQRGSPLRVAADITARVVTRAVLFAPIADEVDLTAYGDWHRRVGRTAILQGWLRTSTVGREIEPLPLGSLPPTTVAACSSFDLLLASREDLRAEAAEPDEQVAHLRAAVGPGPALVVTNGSDGLWLDAGGARQRLDVPQVIQDVSTVGAGDILAASLAASTGEPWVPWPSRAMSAVRWVAEELETRTAR